MSAVTFRVLDPHGQLTSRRRTASVNSREHHLGSLAEDPAEEDQIHDTDTETVNSGKQRILLSTQFLIEQISDSASVLLFRCCCHYFILYQDKLRRIFGLKNLNLKVGWKMFGLIKSRRIKLTKHVARIERKELQTSGRQT